MKQFCKCDKCGVEQECEVEELACLLEGREEIESGGKKKEISTLKYITVITSRLCSGCIRKRKYRFLLFALASACASIPFFITGSLLEFGFVFIVVAVTVALLSTGSHEMEYAARLNYKKWREENKETILHPKMVKISEWEEIKKNCSVKNYKILSGEIEN